MIHVLFNTQYNDAVFEEATVSSWVHGLIYYYKRLYNFDEKTKDERTLVGQWLKRLQETMPENYRTGCHLAAPNAAFMGEDIWIVDGKPQHNLHFRHIPCNKYALLYRKNILWCGVCDRTPFDEEIDKT